MNKKLMPYSIFFFLFSFSFFISYSQIRRGDILNFQDVNDSIYGINIYDRMNIVFGADSIRSDNKKYAVQGWWEDYYENKQLLHKGYYIDGQLKAYKNYFPNGQLEREFKMTDLTKSIMMIYYPDGKLKSNVVYIGQNAIKEEDYYPNGQLEFVEESDKKGEYCLQRKYYSPNGKPTSFLEIIDKKKKIYSSKEYYDNGNIKGEGTMYYNESISDYQKEGLWKFYNENGNFKEEKTFSKGEEG
ncbi:MAG: hypothetical protein V1781_01170 [Bacteroidota bacterium]